MWVNAQRDGRPAEYRWHLLFNAAKFGWLPLLECCAVTLPRCKTRWNLQGCPKLLNRSQPLVGRSSPYYEDTWRRYCCLTTFFPIVNICLSCEDTARQSCAMVSRRQFFASFLRAVFPAPLRFYDDVLYKSTFYLLTYLRDAYSTFQTCILNSHKGHTMCRHPLCDRWD